MYKIVNFEISGKCNAKCKYCANGANSISGHKYGKPDVMIEPSEFYKAIQYMLDGGIIGKETTICLYIWGEPLLHPRIRDIISVLNEQNISFVISTNVSHPVFFEPYYLKNLKSVTLSMPGFSQDSYDRIHGFNFEFIKRNIINMVNNYRENGFKGTFTIAYHLYQFNLLEMYHARQFAESLKIGIHFSAAFFTGYSMLRDYLMNNMEYLVLKNASSELITYHYDDLIYQRPHNYMCPQYERLAVNELCEVLVCCGVDKSCQNHAIGKLFDLSLEEINYNKQNHPICGQCGSIGMDYLCHNPLTLSF